MASARSHRWLPLQLANFMEELESSGLLKEDNVMEGHVRDEAQPSADPASSPPVFAADSTPQDADQGSPPLTAAITASAQDEENPESHAAASLGASQTMALDQSSEAAEQRVLGSLTGCPGWHEVMDMASGKVELQHPDPCLLSSGLGCCRHDVWLQLVADQWLWRPSDLHGRACMLMGTVAQL